jgi:hypothetical protein
MMPMRSWLAVAAPRLWGCALACAACGAAPAAPQDAGPGASAFAVLGPLAPLGGVTDLRFRDLYRMPVGPRGLEPSARLTALSGQRVRMVGYMAQLTDAPPGLLILSPLPVSLSDEDESYADDLPATAVYVHLAPGHGVVPSLPGLLAFQGRLETGAQAEADGRISFVRLQLDPESSRALAPRLEQEKNDEPTR